MNDHSKAVVYIQGQEICRVHINLSMDAQIFDNSHTLRASVLAGVSLFVAVVSVCFAIFNIVHSASYLASSLDLLLAGYAGYTYQVAKQQKHTNSHIQLFVCTLVSVATVASYFQPLEHGTYLWTMAFPVVLYALLGLTHGRIVTALFLIAQLSVIYYNTSDKHSYDMSATLINLASCYAGVWIVAHIYEYNRGNIENSLTYLASRDSLTGAHNRLSLTTAFKHFQRHRDKNTTLCLLFIDLDYFKKINDQYGHDAGDKVLIETTSILGQIVGDNNLYRIGGEEFCITLFDQPITQAENVGERIRSLISQHLFAFGSNRIQVTLSVGICEYSDGDQLSDLLKLADIQLYHAKQNGRNQVRLNRGTPTCNTETEVASSV